MLLEEANRGFHYCVDCSARVHRQFVLQSHQSRALIEFLGVRFEDARVLCEANGMRLCTKEELEAGSIGAHECDSFNGKLAWTSTTCTPPPMSIGDAVGAMAEAA